MRRCKDHFTKEAPVVIGVLKVPGERPCAGCYPGAAFRFLSSGQGQPENNIGPSSNEARWLR